MKKLLLILCFAFISCEKEELIDPTTVVNDYTYTLFCKSGTFKLHYFTSEGKGINGGWSEEIITGSSVTKIIKCTDQWFQNSTQMESIPNLTGDSLYMKCEFNGKKAERTFATKMPNVIINIEINTYDLK